MAGPGDRRADAVLGLRSAEVLGLDVRDVGHRRGGWIRVIGKGDKERRVPMDAEVAGVVQAYLLAERPETATLRAVRGGQGRRIAGSR